MKSFYGSGDIHESPPSPAQLAEADELEDKLEEVTAELERRGPAWINPNDRLPEQAQRVVQTGLHADGHRVTAALYYCANVGFAGETDGWLPLEACFVSRDDNKLAEVTAERDRLKAAMDERDAWAEQCDRDGRIVIKMLQAKTERLQQDKRELVEAAQILVRLGNDTIDAHQDEDNSDYAECDIGECEWCIKAKKSIELLAKHGGTKETP